MNELGMAVIATRCQHDKRLFGLSFRQKQVGEWRAYWSFPLSESANSYEGYDKTELNGSIIIDNGYPGCPYCKNGSFYICTKCHHSNCSTGGNAEAVVCAWCGNISNVVVGNLRDISGSADL